MVKKRLTLAFGMMGLVAALSAGVWAGFRDAPRQLQRLPGGGTVQLLGVTHREQPLLVAGPPLPRLLAPFIPGDQYSRFGLMQIGAPGQSDPLTVWLLYRPVHPPDAQLGPINRIIGANIGATVTDDTGAEFSEEARYGNFDEYSTQHPINLPVFPRRGRELTLHLFDLEDELKPKPRARFTVANPFQRNYPTWAPTPLPARAKAGDLTVVLTELETSLSPRGYGSESDRKNNRRAVFGQQQWSSAAFTTTWKGKPTRDWQPEEVWISDATGNTWKPAQLESNGTGQVRFMDNLWNETAWKLRSRFRQTAGFALHDRVGQGAVLPRKGTWKPSPRVVEVGGESLEILSVAAPKEPVHTPEGGPLFSPLYTLQVRFTTPSATRLSLLKLNGEVAWELGIYDPVEPDKDIWSFHLPSGLPPGPIELEFAVQRTKDVTFIVKPMPADTARNSEENS